MTSSQGWHPEDIKAAIRKSGKTLGGIAIAAGLDRSATSHCLKQPLPAANQAIADYLGRPLHELWPEWFDADGALKPRPRKRITPARRVQRQNREVG